MGSRVIIFNGTMSLARKSLLYRMADALLTFCFLAGGWEDPLLHEGRAFALVDGSPEVEEDALLNLS